MMEGNSNSEDVISGLQFNVDHPNPGIRRVRRLGFRPFRTFRIRYFDFLLLILVAALNLCGIAAIGSAEPALQSRQTAGMAAGMLLAVLISGMDYHRVIRYYWGYYILNTVLLSAVLLFGSSGGGAQRWFALGPIRFQPSEAAKILLILFYAQFIMKYKDKIRSFPMIAACLLLAAVPALLIYEQPDLSTTIMIFIIFCVMMFVGGISWKLVLGVLAVAVPSAAVIFNVILQEGQTLFNEYQRDRVLAWLHPEEYKDTIAYQTMNSIMAIGSGRLLGKGYNTNEISSLLNSGYISESQTDFIFTVIGEEFGFIGTCLVVILILLTAIELFRVAMRASDVSGRVIAAGVGAWVGFQGFMNIGVATGVIPNTGIPLPFVSYGLSSLLSLYMGIGFVLNVNMQSHRRKY